MSIGNALNIIKFLISSLVLFLFFTGCVSSTHRPLDPASPGFEAEVARIHHEAFLIDTHSDTTSRFERPGWVFGERHDTGHMDLPRLREGGYDAVFLSIWMGETPGDGAAVKKAIDRIDSVYEVIRQYPKDLMLATTAADIRRAAAQDKIAILMGVEGGHIIENDLAALRTFYRLGARYLTLTHTFHTDWADSAGMHDDLPALHDGLTTFGETVVLEMNRLGMMVDVSHVSDETFWDVMRVSRAPIVASHSSCRAVADHRRNMTDDMIRAMAARGGVIQINFFPGYIDPKKVHERPRRRREWGENSPPPEPTPGDIVIQHIEHVIQLVGPDYVGLGADFDGVRSLPEGLEDCSRIMFVTRELLKRGYSEEVVKKVLGGNTLRLMEEVEQTAARIQEEEKI